VSKSNWVNTVDADESYDELPTLNELNILFD
ncbi:S-(hydroxymethyl)glutathione synthase, partial [Acinetobacter pittii]